jgi:hypothetical protein
MSANGTATGIQARPCLQNIQQNTPKIKKKLAQASVFETVTIIIFSIKLYFLPLVPLTCWHRQARFSPPEILASAPLMLHGCNASLNPVNATIPET